MRAIIPKVKKTRPPGPFRGPLNPNKDKEAHGGFAATEGMKRTATILTCDYPYSDYPVSHRLGLFHQLDFTNLVGVLARFISSVGKSLLYSVFTLSTLEWS